MPIVLFFTMTDGDDTSRVEIPIPDATPLAAAAALVPAAAALINPLVNGGLLSAGFTVYVDVPTFGPVAALIADVQEKAEFVFRTAGGFIKRLNLPTFIETFFVGGGSGKEVDTTDPDVQAFIDFMTDGIAAGGSTNPPVDYRGDDIETLVEARQNWGRRRV